MDLILATADGRELKSVWNDIDIDIGITNTFEMTVPTEKWDTDIKYDRLLYIPDTEYGGIVRDIETNTTDRTIYIRGYTWRGYLAHRIIEPPAGQDYLVVSGELHTVMSSVLGGSLGTLFRVSGESTGVTVQYQFNRYVSYVDGISAMLAQVGYRLQIKYIETDLSGYVELSAVPVSEYDSDITTEYTLGVTTQGYKMGTNHLICLGQGELHDRTVIHLYADANGNISQTKSLTGLDEIVETYENTSAESEQLLETGIERLKELLNYKKLSVSFSGATDQEMYIGDMVTGRDYITGVIISLPIAAKIMTRHDGNTSVEYRVEGEDE